MKPPRDHTNSIMLLSHIAGFCLGVLATIIAYSIGLLP